MSIKHVCSGCEQNILENAHSVCSICTENKKQRDIVSLLYDAENKLISVKNNIAKINSTLNEFDTEQAEQFTKLALQAIRRSLEKK